MLDTARDALQLNELVAEAVRAKARHVRLEPRTYELSGELLPDTFCMPSNNDEGMKRIAIDVTDARDLVIDGQGARLVFHGEVMPVRLMNCRNVCLKNLSIDWRRPFMSQGQVIDTGPDDVLVEIDPEAYPLDVSGDRLVLCDARGYRNDKLWNVMGYDPVRPELAFDQGDNFSLERQYSACRAGEREFRISGRWHTIPKPGQRAVLMQGNRLAPGVFMDRCTDTQLEHVTLHHAPGMGFLGQLCRNTSVTSCRVAPSGDRLFSTWVDASHFTDCDGTLELDRCEFRGQCDDMSNIHGAYWAVVDRPDDHTVIAQIRHPQQRGVPALRPGDTAAFHDRRNLAELDRLAVVSARFINRFFVRLEFAARVPDADELALRRHAADLDVRIIDCRFGPNRGRGLLLSAWGRLRVQRNHFHTACSAILLESDCNYWWESGPVNDLLVEDNHFDSCCFGRFGHAVVQASPRVRDAAAASPVHRNVRVVHNRFTLCREPVLRADFVERLAFQHNQFAWSSDYEPDRTGGFTRLGGCLPDAAIQPLEPHLI